MHKLLGGDKVDQYLFQGYWEFRGSAISAIVVYIMILAFLWISNKRRKFVITKSILELFFITYCICVLKITGIIGMKFNLSYFSFSMLPLGIPFVGGSLKMIFLNFLLFAPYGFLLPIVFKNSKWSYKKIIVIGFATTIIIEILQVFAGRFSEIDDILTNGFGTLVGYIIYVSLGKIKDKDNRRRGIIQLLTTCLVVAITTVSISLVCKEDENIEYVPDGIEAIPTEEVLYIKSYHNDNIIDLNEDMILNLNCDISNYIFFLDEVKSISKNIDEIINNDDNYFVEIRFKEPQNIKYSSNGSFEMKNVVSIMLDVNNYTLYWGDEYDMYTEEGDSSSFKNQELKYKKESKEKYDPLKERIKQYFEK